MTQQILIKVLQLQLLLHVLEPHLSQHSPWRKVGFRGPSWRRHRETSENIVASLSHFHARPLFRGELFWTWTNFGLMLRDRFFFMRFHEMISFETDLLSRTNFFFRCFHEAFQDESFTKSCNFELSFFRELFRDRMRTDFFDSMDFSPNDSTSDVSEPPFDDS